MFPCSDPVEPLNPDPPAAIDNLGIRCQGPVLAQILGAKLPLSALSVSAVNPPPSSPSPQRLSGESSRTRLSRHRPVEARPDAGAQSTLPRRSTPLPLG
jgi:hypothetical protein